MARGLPTGRGPRGKSVGPEDPPIPWGDLYHRATVTFGRTDRQFWRMTIAQLHYLTAAHLGGTASAVTAEPAPTGSLGDLLAFDRLQR